MTHLRPAARVGLGCMVLSGFYGRPDEANAIATLERALDLGVTLFDTADIYSDGRNEELLGRVLGSRSDAIIATKFGNVAQPDGSWRVDARPERVRSACDGSLRRLRRERIDIYYLHRIDPLVPIAETVGAMSELVQAGKVDALGLSEAAPETIRRAHATSPVSWIQSEYSLWARDPEHTVLPLCRELGMSFAAYSPLGRGFLAGAVRSRADLPEGDHRLKFPRFAGHNLERNAGLQARLEEVARARGCSAAQLALAWLLHQGDDIFAIPGTTDAGHLEANVAALDMRLSQADLAAVEAAVPPDAVAGERYPAASMRKLDL